jgi:hypothetical protein
MGRSSNNNARKEGIVDWSQAIVQALHLPEENHGKLSRDRHLRGQELILLKSVVGDYSIWIPKI